MDKSALVSFISFVEIDHEVVRLTQQKDLLLLESAQIEKEMLNLVRQKEELDTKLRELKKKIDSLNLDLKALDAQKKEKKERFEEAANTKQYLSLEQELASIRQQQSGIEEIILNLWQEHEHAEEVAQAVAQQADTTKNLLEASREKNKIALEQLQTQIDNRLEDRKKLELVVSPELLLTYNTMKERVANPAVPVINGSCSGCFYAVTPHDLQALKNRSLMTCKDCYRMLYLPQTAQDL